MLTRRIGHSFTRKVTIRVRCTSVGAERVGINAKAYQTFCCLPRAALQATVSSVPCLTYFQFVAYLAACALVRGIAACPCCHFFHALMRYVQSRQVRYSPHTPRHMHTWTIDCEKFRPRPAHMSPPDFENIHLTCSHQQRTAGVHTLCWSLSACICLMVCRLRRG